jgi:predicted phosphoribosyltransferase
MIPREDSWGTYERRSFWGHSFRDRSDAGVKLARALERGVFVDPLVLAIPRGGVPVAREVARALHAELDVIVARKLGAPGQRELALGAVAADGTVYINEALRAAVGGSDAELAGTLEAERSEARRRERCFRAGLPPLRIEGRTVIVVDDGLATGATMRAAVRALRKQHPGKLIVAAPVGAPETCASIAREVDELVCPHQPDPLFSVGEHYRDFEQTSDEEVEQILREARRGTRGCNSGQAGA